jgi:hypothetical protein
VNIRFYIDPETGLPHIYRHRVDEADIDTGLMRPKLRIYYPAQKMTNRVGTALELLLDKLGKGDTCE